MLPQQPRHRRGLAVAVGDEVEVRLLRQALLEHVEIRHQQPRHLLARHRQDVQHRVHRVDHAGRRDQRQLLDAMAVLAGELGREVAAERQADQVEPVELQHIEQLEVVHDVVVQVGKGRIVARLAEARMIRHDHLEPLGPRLGEIEAVDRAGAVEEHDRLAVAGGVHDRLHAVDRVGLARELAHAPPRSGSTRPRRAARAAHARAQPRDHLLGEQRQVLDGLPVRHVGDVHDAVDVVGLHPLRPLADLVGDLVGRAHGDEERLADGVEIEAAVHLVGHRRAHLELLDREIAGRRQVLRRGARVVLEEALQVDDVLLLGALLRLGDVDEGQQRQLVGPQGVAVVGGALAQGLVELAGALLGDEHRRVAEAELGGDLDRLRAAGADDVAGRMRPLVGARPRIQEAVGVEVAVVRGGAVLGPRLQHDLERFLELARARSPD